jgi:hypothetical protein
MKNRGVGEAVITILIILIGLAAVAIIWGFIQPSIKKDSSQITSACIELELEPTSCEYSGSGTNYSAIVRVERGGDDIILKELKIIFDVGLDSEVKSSTNIPDPLGAKSITFTDFTSPPQQINVAGLIETEFGQNKLCAESQYKVDCVASS